MSLVVWSMVGLLWGCLGPEAEGEFLDRTYAIPVEAEITPITLADVPVGTSQIRFAVSTASTGVDASAFGFLMVYLESALEFPFQLVETRGYGATVAAIEGGDTGLALLPPLSYVRLKARMPELRLVAQAVAQGTRAYSSFVLVRFSSPVEVVSDLRGSHFTFVDPQSTSGFLFPYLDLLDHGVDPETDLRGYDFAGSHIAALDMLVNGQTDAIGTFSGLLDQANRQAYGMGRPEYRIRILHKAGRIPHDAICAGGDFPASGLDKIRAALWNFNTQRPEGMGFYRDSGHYTGWLPLEDDADYDSVRRAWRRVEPRLPVGER